MGEDGEGYFVLRVYHHSRYGRREASHADTDSDTSIFPLSFGATHSGETVEMSRVVPSIVFPAHAIRVGDGRRLVTPPHPDRATQPPRSGRIRKEPSRGHGCLTRRLV